MPRNGVDSRIPRFKPGSATLRASHLNLLVDDANKRRSINAPVQKQPRGKTGGSPVLVLTLVSHENDYLVCEDADTNEYIVAKVYELRRTPFDGETIGGITYTYASASEREASDGASPPELETQFITPAYVVGAEIYAIKVQGNTGVETTDSPPVPILYIEMNQGRAWAWDEGA